MKFRHLRTSPRRTPWNKGKITGQKAPLKLKEIWAIRFRLQEAGRVRELALFNLAIDSKRREAAAHKRSKAAPPGPEVVAQRRYRPRICQAYGLP